MDVQQQLTPLESHGEQETEALGLLLGRCLTPGSIVGLVGELGAGKTCFARGVARGLDVPPDIHVSSPTFTLVNEYTGRIPLYHVDLYRLGDPGELEEIGLDEYYGGEGACLVEWFNRFPEETPGEHLRLDLLVTGDDSRSVVPTAVGETHLKLALRWSAMAKAQ